MNQSQTAILSPQQQQLTLQDWEMEDFPNIFPL